MGDAIGELARMSMPNMESARETAYYQDGRFMNRSKWYDETGLEMDQIRRPTLRSLTEAAHIPRRCDGLKAPT